MRSLRTVNRIYSADVSRIAARSYCRNLLFFPVAAPVLVCLEQARYRTAAVLLKSNASALLRRRQGVARAKRDTGCHGQAGYPLKPEAPQGEPRILPLDSNQLPSNMSPRTRHLILALVTVALVALTAYAAPVSPESESRHTFLASWPWCGEHRHHGDC